jgi:hypothetical protein
VLSVPVTDDRSLVVGLPERFWVQCPRFLPTRTSLDGDGLIAQYMNARGGTVSMLYVGSVPFSATVDAATPATREARAAATVLDFVASLADKYAQVDWAVTSAPVAVAPTPWTLDGKKVPAWRTKRYASRPAAAYGGPRSVFSGECLLFLVPETDRVAYVALDAKGGGTTLDKAIAQVSVRPTREVNREGRRVQLNDIAQAADASRFPVRQVAFDLPPGFVLTRRVVQAKGDWVWVEERLDAEGHVDAILRIHQRHADATHTVAQDRDDERAFWRDEERGPAEAVPLATKGQQAWVFAHPSPVDGPAARAMTAVLRVDDQVLLVTWTTLGDAAARERDHAAFVAMVKTLDWTVRW